MKKPANWSSISTKDAIEITGFVEFLDAGFPYFSPIGQRIKTSLEKLLSDTCERKGFNRVQLPSLHRKEFVERSGKYAQFKDEFVDVAEDYVLTSTSEEYFLELAKKGLESYIQLPVRLFEIGNAIRFIQRPRGILKLREFSGAVLNTFEEDDQGYDISLLFFKKIIQDILGRLRIPFKAETKNEGIEYFYNPKNIDLGEPVSLAMGYKYKSSPQEVANFRLKRNELSPVIMGTFGIGLERLFYALCDSCRDNAGFNFPDIMCPYERAVVLVSSRDSLQMRMGEDIYNSEREKNIKIYLEDRNSITLKEKLDYADFLGVKEKILIGPKEVKQGKPTIKIRKSKQ